MKQMKQATKLDELESLVKVLLERSASLRPMLAFANFGDACLFIESLGRLKKVVRT